MITDVILRGKAKSVAPRRCAIVPNHRVPTVCENCILRARMANSDDSDSDSDYSGGEALEQANDAPNGEYRWTAKVAAILASTVLESDVWKRTDGPGLRWRVINDPKKALMTAFARALHAHDPLHVVPPPIAVYKKLIRTLACAAKGFRKANLHPGLPEEIAEYQQLFLQLHERKAAAGHSLPQPEHPRRQRGRLCKARAASASPSPSPPRKTRAASPSPPHTRLRKTRAAPPSPSPPPAPPSPPRTRARAAQDGALTDESTDDGGGAAPPSHDAKRVRCCSDLVDIVAMQIKAQAAHDRLELERLRAHAHERATMLEFMAHQSQLMRDMMAMLTSAVVPADQ